MKFNQKNFFHYIAFLSYFINLFVCIFFFVLFLRPKKNNIYLTGHKLIGNLEILFNNQKTDKNNIYFITINLRDYFILKKKYNNTQYSSNIKTFHNPIDAFNFLTAKAIVASHGLFFNKIYIKYLKIKTIYCGHAIDGVYPVKVKKYFKHLKNFSEVWMYSSYELNMYVNDFKYPYKNLKSIGYPRVHYLFENKKNKNKLKENLKINKKIILYAPTASRGSLNYLKSDLRLYNIKTLKILEKFLEKNNSIFIIKLHLNDKLSDEEKNYINQSQHIFEQGSFMVKFDYDLLIMSDILITDYSTIYIDFLILDKPILFVRPPNPNLSWKYTFIVNNEFIDRIDSLQALLSSINMLINTKHTQKKLLEIKKSVFKDLKIEKILDSSYKSLEKYLY